MTYCEIYDCYETGIEGNYLYLRVCVCITILPYYIVVYLHYYFTLVIVSFHSKIQNVAAAQYVYKRIIINVVSLIARNLSSVLQVVTDGTTQTTMNQALDAISVRSMVLRGK